MHFEVNTKLVGSAIQIRIIKNPSIFAQYLLASYGNKVCIICHATQSTLNFLEVTLDNGHIGIKKHGARSLSEENSIPYINE